MSTKTTIKRAYFTAAIIISIITLTLSATAGQNFLAVLDLSSNGSMPKKNILLISDKISEVVAAEGNYTLFARNMIPELLKQLSVEEPATTCSNEQCLVLIGSLMGANAIIGGFIKYKNNLTEIELNLVDIDTKRTLNSVTMRSHSKKTIFLNSEIPALVNNLLNPGTNPPPKIAAKKRTIFTNPFLYAGTLLVSGAAAGAYYFKYYKNENGGTVENEGNMPLSMDDIPVRTRGSE